ncbi:MAG: hypothetical protein FWG04_01040 [Desulfovibrionaceae bacterium]|nr:hypothetical protein [Desulfovibrionaceae bacterium]
MNTPVYTNAAGKAVTLTEVRELCNSAVELSQGIADLCAKTLSEPLDYDAACTLRLLMSGACGLQAYVEALTPEPEMPCSAPSAGFGLESRPDIPGSSSNYLLPGKPSHQDAASASTGQCGRNINANPGCSKGIGAGWRRSWT